MNKELVIEILGLEKKNKEMYYAGKIGAMIQINDLGEVFILGNIPLFLKQINCIKYIMDNPQEFFN